MPGFSTKSIKGKKRWPVSDVTESLTTPIYETATFTIRSPEDAAEIIKRKGATFAKGKEDYIYSRGGNPTCRELEHKLADLEGGEDAISFGSGMGAITAIAMTVLKKGDHVVCTDTVFGDTCYLFDTVMRKYGVECDFVDTTKLDLVKDKLKDNTKMVFIETPANPTLKVTDIAGLSKLLGKDTLLVVDNSFMSPYLQQPLKLGADVVVHSMTKYIGGHSDALGGIAVGSKDFVSDMRMMFYTTGAVLDAFPAWLFLRSLHTLSLRMEQHCSSAMKIAEFLKNNPKVEEVYYPGLKEHPQHELAKKQMKNFGGMVAFILKDGMEAGKKLLKNTELCLFAVSLGTSHTLIQHPASMTHAIMTKEQREKSGIFDGLVRISVGLEDVEDIISDLDQALKKV